MGSCRYFFMGAVTVFFGYFAGVLSVSSRAELPLAEVEAYFRTPASRDWFRAFCTGPLFLCIALLFGVFLLGWLFIFPLLFYKAYGFGFTAGLFFAAMGTQGLLPLGLCVFPSALAQCLMLVFSAKDAFPLSFSLFLGIRGSPVAFFEALRPYFLRGLILIQCSSILLLWDLYLSPLILDGLRSVIS